MTATTIEAPKTRTRKVTTKASDFNNQHPSGGLRLSIGMRYRLNDEERYQLREAYDRASKNEAPVAHSSFGDVTATTQFHNPSLTASLGMDRYAFSSLVGSRESIPIALVKRFQRVLGVSLLTEDYIRQAFEGYLCYLEANDVEPQ
jgi:hypothetical protein